MKKGWWVLIGVGVFAILFLLMLMGMYNSLVTLDESVNNKWANVDAVIQRRSDLIPNLIATVKGAADFEKSTYLAVTNARTNWLSAGTLNEKVAAANKMEGALARLLVSVENYPNLKATENFKGLQDELANTENKISVERKRYNDAVTSFNKKTRRFPTNLIANMFGFDKRIYFEAENKEVPVVDFA